MGSLKQGYTRVIIFWIFIRYNACVTRVVLTGNKKKQYFHETIFFVKILLLHFKIFSNRKTFVQKCSQKKYFQLTQHNKMLKGIAIHIFVAILLVKTARVTRALQGFVATGCVRDCGSGSQPAQPAGLCFQTKISN